MAQPTPYNRAFNFADFQSENPANPLPGARVDEELSRVKLTTDQIRAALRLLQRDDTALANNSVGIDQLKAEVQIGVNPPTAWATEKNYVARDTVFESSNFYLCEVSHVSGVFNDDLLAGKWTKIASFEAATSAASVSFNDAASDLGAATTQAAIDALKALHDALDAALSPAVAANTAARHTHLNKTVLDAIEQAFTTALKDKLDGIAAGADVNLPVGTTAGTVAAGDDSRIVGAIQKAVDAILAAGYTATVVDDGTKSSGTYTPSPAGGNWRKIANNGAFTLAAPTAAGCYSLTIDITNGATAGAIAFSGFAAGHPKGDALVTTSGAKAKLHIAKSDVGVTAVIEAGL
jgi:hypothetical protein